MSAPKLTVVIPCHQHHETLRRAVLSAWTAGANDVIVVDDGCNPRLSEGAYHLIRSNRYGLALGVCAARNLGIAEAERDSLILCLDADDELQEDGVRLLREAWQPGTFVYGGYLRDGQYHAPRPVRDVHQRELTGVNLLVQREDLLRVGGYPRTFDLGCEGWALQAALLDAGLTGIRVDTPVLTYHHGEGKREQFCRWNMPLIRALLARQYAVMRA